MSTAVQRLDVSGAVDVAFLVAALPQATVSSLLLHFQWAIWLLQLDICFQFTLVISSMISTWKSLNLKLSFDIGWCVPSCYQEAVKLLLLLFIQNIHSNFFFMKINEKLSRNRCLLVSTSIVGASFDILVDVADVALFLFYRLSDKKKCSIELTKRPKSRTIRSIFVFD